MSAPWLVALDVDGTLVPDGTCEVLPATAAAVAEVVAAGHEVVLATGRSLVGVLPVAAALGLTGWVVASNGAVTARLDPTMPGGYADVDAYLLDVGPVARTARELLAEVELAAEEIGWGYTVSHLFADGLLNGRQFVSDFDELCETSTPRLVLRAPGVVASLVDPVRRLGVTVNAVGADWIDVTPPEVSKASALEEVRRRLGIPAAHTMALGDGGNDTPMFEWAARAVAMGHASAAVQQAADNVTGCLDEDGAAAALRALLAPAADLLGGTRS